MPPAKSLAALRRSSRLTKWSQKNSSKAVQAQLPGYGTEAGIPALHNPENQTRLKFSTARHN